MKLKVFSFLAWLLCSTFLGATGSPQPVNLSTPTICYKDPCEAPPPPDFHVEEQGIDWVKYAWTVGDLLQHRVRTYRASDNFLLNTTTAGGGVSNITVPIPANTECYAIINTICEDGSNSSRQGYCPPFPGLIVDLIVDGYTNNYNNTLCTITGTSQWCNFPTSGTVPFWITDNGETKRFGIERVSFEHFKVYTAAVEGETFKFYCSYGSPASCSLSQNVTIRRRSGLGTEVTIATLDLTSGTNTNTLSGTVASGYFVQRVVESIGGPPEDRYGFEQVETITEQRKGAITSPNPFSESLDIYLSHPATGSVQFQLFNLSGQKVLNQQLGGGQEQYTLSTTGLSSGFYLLRIEADGEVQTLKVVKSE